MLISSKNKFFRDRQNPSARILSGTSALKIPTFGRDAMLLRPQGLLQKLFLLFEAEGMIR